MKNSASSVQKLHRLYGEMASSMDGILAALAAAGVDKESVRACDLYERGLDCQNLGAYSMLERLAAVATEEKAPGPGDSVLDLGCGLGGPGRFLVDRFGCSVRRGSSGRGNEVRGGREDLAGLGRNGAKRGETGRNG